MTSKTLADWIKSERENRGWTQEKLAEFAGIERVEIVALEKGRNKGSSLRIRQALSRAFSVPLREVGGGTIPISEEVAELKLNEQPWWTEIRQQASKLFPRTPAWAYDMLGNLRGEVLPPPSPVCIGMMADAWHQGAMQEEEEEKDRKK